MPSYDKPVPAVVARPAEDRRGFVLRFGAEHLQRKLCAASAGILHKDKPAYAEMFDNLPVEQAYLFTAHYRVDISIEWFQRFHKLRLYLPTDGRSIDNRRLWR
jgi:hypothetical protein